MKFVTIASLAMLAAISSAQLFSQAPHVPGTANNNGLSAFKGVLAPDNYDRMVADDFVVTGGGWSIDRVVSNWLQFTPGDANPITSMTVNFYDGTGGVVGSLINSQSITTVGRTTGPGTYFSRPEQILDVSLTPVNLGPGTYFMMLQPNVDHNWFWITHQGVTVNGSAAQIMRGPTAGPTIDTTWPSTWTPTGPANPAFTTAYDAAFQLYGNPVPEPASMAVLGLGALALLRKRRSKKA
jgi:hypothetical protein